MSNQGSATISRYADEITEDFERMGFEVDRSAVDRMICESDVLDDDTQDLYAWVEAADSAPGETEKFPHIAYCTCSYRPDAVAVKTYKPVA